MVASLAATLTLAGAFAACLQAVRWLRRPGAPLELPLAAALLVCLEALAVNALSPLRAVTATGLLLVNLGAAAAGAAAWWRRGGRPRRPRWSLRWLRSPPCAAVAALGVLILLAALAYRPNNADSMSYHLARVAYWIQWRTVEPYPVVDLRQVTYPPGAEYLLLLLQAISASDRLANLVQAGAWVLLAASAPGLARLFGAPRALAPWAALLVASAPMAVLQGSSTQNDLVSAAMALAVIGAALPFLHRRPRWRGRDLFLLAAAGAGALMVKPTSLVVTAPFLGWGLWRTLRTVRAVRSRRRWAGAAAGLAAGLLLVAAVAGPFQRAVRASPEGRRAAAFFLYAGLAEPGDRLLNALRGAVREAPLLPARLTDRLSPASTTGCSTARSLCSDCNRAPFEDCAGNVGQALVVLLASGVALRRGRRLPLRSRIALALLAASWLLFHAVFRDNPWTGRLRLPLLALAPMVLSAFGAGWLRRPLGRAGLALPGLALFLLGLAAAVLNTRRPLDGSFLARGRSEDVYYYPDFVELGRRHRAALGWLERSGCKRLGVYLGGTGLDYPLAWRAMQRGIEVRHVVEPDAWPCAVFSEREPPPPLPGVVSWRPAAGAEGLFVPAPPPPDPE